MLAIPVRASFRALGRQWAWVLYAAVLLAILATAARLRYGIPHTPLFDGDSWGYLAPAFTKLTGGAFQHAHGRNFLYPGFLFVVLSLSGDYGAITVWQHALGLLTGVLLALAWNLLCDLLAPPGRARMAARFLGLAAVADYLLSRSPIFFEQTIRPEAVFPLFVALSFALNFYAMNPRHAVRRPALVPWLLGLNLVVVCVAASLKPSTGFAVIAMNLPLVFWLIRRGDPWREKLKVTSAALAVVAFALWLPERQLARSDPMSATFLPETLFTIHARIIHEQILDDLRNGHTAPYAPAWLAAFNRNLERVLAVAALPENRPWPTIGFDADILMYRDSVFDPFFGPGKERDTIAFCNRYYWRTWLHRPGAMLSEVAAQLAIVYDPARSKGDRISRPLSFEYTHSLDRAQRPWVQPRLDTSPSGQRYLTTLRALTHTNSDIQQFRLSVHVNDWLNRLRMPLLIVALAAGIPLLAQPAARPLVGAVWLCLLVNFSVFLTVAVVHTLDIDRYLQSQHACTVLGDFAALLLPWQCFERRSGGLGGYRTVVVLSCTLASILVSLPEWH